MNYAEWLVGVPSEVTNDQIWKLEAQQLTHLSSFVLLHYTSLSRKPISLFQAVEHPHAHN